MTDLARLLLDPYPLLIASVLGIVAAGTTAQAQNVDGLGAIVPPRPMFMMHERTFNQVALGAREAPAIRSRLDSLLTLKVEELERACGITRAQGEKLQIAGRGDIKRLFDRIEEKKRYLNVPLDHARYTQLIREAQALQAVVNADAFGDGSLFAKVLKRVLDEEQAAHYEALARDKRLFRYRARIELLVSTLDNIMGMTDAQRRRLVELLLAETQPPRMYSQYDSFVVILQAARLPESKIRPIFDDVQWRTLVRRFEQAKMMESTLRRGGYLPDSRTAAPPAEGKE